MLRKILFKAKTKDTGEWVFGYYAYIQRTYCKSSGMVHLIIDDFGVDMEIDRNTLCQFTGLRDMDGNLIFENDIIRMFADFKVEVYTYTDIDPIFDDHEYQNIRTMHNGIVRMTSAGVILRQCNKYNFYDEDDEISTTISTQDNTHVVGKRSIVLGNRFDNPELNVMLDEQTAYTIYNKIKEKYGKESNR